MTTLDPCRPGDALRAGACGIHPHEAGTGLLVDCGSWLHRDDFTSRFITTGASISDGVTLLASIAGGTPVSLHDAIPGIDQHSTQLLVTAIRRASGSRQGHQR
jgi:hypothetical protein